APPPGDRTTVDRGCARNGRTTLVLCQSQHDDTLLSRVGPTPSFFAAWFDFIPFAILGLPSHNPKVAECSLRRTAPRGSAHRLALYPRDRSCLEVSRRVAMSPEPSAGLS